MPFGEMWLEHQHDANTRGEGYIPFRFTSKEWDEETGLYYYGARYLEPKLSRWMSVDPAGRELVNPMDGEGKPRSGYSVVEALNWYSYVSNNPIKYIDPTGEQTATLTVSLPEITMVTQLSAFIQANPWLLVLLFPFLITGDSGPSNVMMAELDDEGGAKDTPSPVIDKPIEESNSEEETHDGIDWENDPPASSDDLGEEWEDITHPDNKKGGREFKNKKTGKKIHFDQAEEEAPGYEGKDHWHRYNPDSTGKGDLYLDAKGNPTPKGKASSHILAE